MKVPNSSANLIPLQPFSDVQLCVKIQQGFRNKTMKNHIHTQFALQKHVPQSKIGHPMDCAKKGFRGQSPLMLRDARLLFSRNSTENWRVLVYVRVGSFRLPMTVLQERDAEPDWISFAPRASALSFIDTNLVTKHQNWQFCQSPRHSGGPSIYRWYLEPTTTAFGSIIEGEMWKILSPKTIHRLIPPTKVHPSEIRGISQMFRKKKRFIWEGKQPTPTFVGTFATFFFAGAEWSSPSILGGSSQLSGFHNQWVSKSHNWGCFPSKWPNFMAYK